MFFKSLILIALSGTFVVKATHEKSIISYLGSNFLMSDGCPLPKCDESSLDCEKTHNMIRALYSHCIQSEEGQHVGCVTDRMADGTYLTLPIYATVCSAMCYEPPEGLERIKKCPHPGFRQHSPNLNEVFS